MLNTVKRSVFSFSMALAMLLTAALAPQVAHASFNVYVSFNGAIPVSSKVKNYEKYAEAYAFTFASQRQISFANGGGAEMAIPNLGDISFTRPQDGSSPGIWNALILGTVVPKVTIVLADSMGKKISEIDLEKAVISNYSVSGSTGGDDRPIENFTIAFGKITYTTFGTSSTGAVTSTAKCWDVVQATGC